MFALRKKAGVAAVIAGASLAAFYSPTAFAGTGGADNAGVIYGQDAAYCDAQAATLLKTDSLSGAALGSAVFNVVNNSTAAQNLGLKVYASDPTVDADSNPATPTQLQADRIAWQESFDNSIDAAFSKSTLGAVWMAARVTTTDAQIPGQNGDRYWSVTYSDGTAPKYFKTSAEADAAVAAAAQGVTATKTEGIVYRANQSVTFPANITAITDASAQKAAMQSWPNMAASSGIVTVDQFGGQVKDRLDKIGAVLYSNYSAATGTGTTVRPEIAGSDSLTQVQAAFTKATTEWNNFKASVTNAGYKTVKNDGTVDKASFDASTQNWVQFVTAYNAMTAKGAFAFGVLPPTYDVMAKSIGDTALGTAARTADTAVKATSTANNASVSATTNAAGRIYVGVFGRDLTSATLSKDCSAQRVSFVETTAPTGYVLDPTVTPVTMANAEDAIASVTKTNTLQNTPMTPDTPVPPSFESGL